jgi:uncharacterized protein (TIGR02594 family)
MTSYITDIQKALASSGFSPGQVDGIWGRRTQRAVREFQAANGLIVDGVVGPKTAEKLFGKALKTKPGQDPALVWLQEARRLMGTKEAPGLKSNPEIVNWSKDLDIKYSGDDVPWCGLFVAHCVGSTLKEEPLPTNPLSARAWRKFGGPTTPRIGAIMVFWRKDPNGPYGHVGFYGGETGSSYVILGGNQSDSVNLTKISKTRLLEARWPATVSDEGFGILKVKDDGTKDSVNEA